MAASGYKLFATGDVLTAADVNNYLMLQTVMVFANSAARTTALSGVLAEGLVSYLKDTDVVEIYTGAAWVSLDDPNAVQNASYYAAGKNAIINGAFNVWQRGTSNTTTASAYTADRWQKGGQTIFGVSRQLTSDTTNLPTIQYCARVQRTAGSTSTAGWDFAQSLESATSQRFVGQTVILSYYARKGADFSSASSALTPQIYYGTGTDQSIIGTYTGATNVGGTTATLTTTWQRFSTSVSIPVTATEMAINFYCAGVGTAGTNDYYEITGVQLEIGSTATAFQTASGTIGGELALCQRYYWRSTGGSLYAPYGTALAPTTTAMQIAIVFPVPMRVNPTSVDSSTLQANDGNSVLALSAVALSNASTVGTSLSATVAGATQFRVYQVGNNNSLSGYLGFSAEL